MPYMLHPLWEREWFTVSYRRRSLSHHYEVSRFYLQHASEGKVRHISTELFSRKAATYPGS
jgi:hypothetical protein